MCVCARACGRQVVENMAYFDGDDGKRYHPFGPGYTKELAEACELSPEQAISLPILPALARASDGGEDGGRPYVLAAPDGDEVAAAYGALGERLVTTLLHHRFAVGGSSGASIPTVLADPERGLVLRFFSGARESEEHALPAAAVRAACRSATAANSAKAAEKDGLHAVSVEARGNYAVAVVWSDRHESLFSYGQLEALLEEAEAGG